ncbi:MAG: alpha/beta hydrolase [Pseudomonadota bacterium]
MAKVFLHGVPDTPFMWSPLIGALALEDADYVALSMPGFAAPAPAGFSSTKEAYLDWLIASLEEIHGRSGPVDLVGHDWGAILCVRAAHMRPDLIRSWMVSNALPDPDYQWHTMARQWQTPVLGELVMALAAPKRMEGGLVQAGMPADIAAHEAPRFSRNMKRSILRLYRSAKMAGVEWGSDLSDLPDRGLVVWGELDPYVPLGVAERFCERWNIPLHVERGAGHWAVCERPDAVAARLKSHWAGEAPAPTAADAPV